MNAIFGLPANQVIDVLTLPLEERVLDADATLQGVARVGTRALGHIVCSSTGVWEMSPSVSTDVEVDEVFVVLAGEATVAFDDGTPPLELRPGSLVRLQAGSRTTWTVRQTLRKLYVI
jgi:uncharacterized cupin superfamily protein